MIFVVLGFFRLDSEDFWCLSDWLYIFKRIFLMVGFEIWIMVILDGIVLFDRVKMVLVKIGFFV